VIEKWSVDYNTRRPDSALGYKPPAPVAFALAVVQKVRSVCLRSRASEFVL